MFSMVADGTEMYQDKVALGKEEHQDEYYNSLSDDEKINFGLANSAGKRRMMKTDNFKPYQSPLDKFGSNIDARFSSAPKLQTAGNQNPFASTV